MYRLMSLLLMLCPLSAFFLGAEDSLIAEPPTTNTPYFVNTSAFEGVIIPEGYLEDTYGYSYGISWTPTDEDILAMDESVAAFLRDSGDPMLEFSEVPAWERLGEYSRHYYGLTIDGEDVIHAEYYCDTIYDDWWEQPLVVMDGGDCYFRFDYNPATETFFNLNVNGMA